MGYASKEALLEYTQDKSKGPFFTIIACGGFVVGLICLSGDFMWFGLFMIVMSAISLFSDLSGNGSYKKFLSTAVSTGELQRIINDFAASQSLADDRIRLGDEYIFGRKMGRPISYAELRKVYPFIVTGTTCARCLKGVTVNGQEHVLCDFIVRSSQKTPHPDENAIYQHILSKNPNIYLGYK